jgi:hypothetical protein
MQGHDHCHTFFDFGQSSKLKGEIDTKVQYEGYQGSIKLRLVVSFASFFDFFLPFDAFPSSLPRTKLGRRFLYE